MNPKSNPFAEPLLIALLAVLLSMLILAAMVFWRLSEPGQKEVAEYGLYGALFGTFTTSIGALVQALSRDPATARANAQAAATNAATVAANSNPAPTPAAAVEVTGPDGGPVKTEAAA